MIRFSSRTLLHEGVWCIRVKVGTEFLVYSSGAITNTYIECVRKEGNYVSLLIWSDASSSSREYICFYCSNISPTFRAAIQYIYCGGKAGLMPRRPHIRSISFDAIICSWSQRMTYGNMTPAHTFSHPVMN